MTFAGTIVIVNFNGGQALVRCLESIALHAPGARVIVVDNASSDGSLQHPALRASQVTLVTNRENVGFGRGVNQGVRAASTGHVLILNPDCVLTAGAAETLVAELVGKWLRDEAWSFVAPQVDHYARRITAAAPTLRLSNARSEWGSCNARGEIRLNWRLVQLPPTLAEYVVAHEVAHLIELNHSPRFWALVETLIPGHAALRRELEDWTALLAA